ncbi:MAG: glycosyltransferase [Bacteroidetes bacterium]|nr:glycosyltransferase [Bacteroidota bacterium]
MKKHKILLIGPAFPLRGGLATFDELFCQSLVAEGHDAQIISYALQYPSFLFPGSTQYDTTGKAPRNIIIHTLINSINPLNWVKTALFIRKQKPDFLIIRFWLPFMAPALGTIIRLINKKKTKVLAITDNVIPHEKRIGDALFTSYFISVCDGFVTMSQAVMNDLNTFTTNKHKKFLLHPLYTSFGEKLNKEEARKQLQLLPSDKVILFFGLIRAYKGLDLLLEAMNEDRIKKAGIKLLIAGEFYEDKKPYLDLIEKNKLTNLVLFDTFIPNEEVKLYFSAANLLALPYKHATQSGVTQVAFHFEIPTLVTNVGGLAEIIPDKICGYAVPPQAAAIADAIVDYFENNRENAMSKAMQEEKKKYEWSIFSKNVVQLYEEIKT